MTHMHMKLYYCGACLLNFSVESAAMELPVACPVCKDDRDVEEDGFAHVLRSPECLDVVESGIADLQK